MYDLDSLIEQQKSRANFAPVFVKKAGVIETGLSYHSLCYILYPKTDCYKAIV